MSQNILFEHNFEWLNILKFKLQITQVNHDQVVVQVSAVVEFFVNFDLVWHLVASRHWAANVHDLRVQFVNDLKQVFCIRYDSIIYNCFLFHRNVFEEFLRERDCFQLCRLLIQSQVQMPILNWNGSKVEILCHNYIFEPKINVWAQVHFLLFKNLLLKDIFGIVSWVEAKIKLFKNQRFVNFCCQLKLCWEVAT